MFNIPIVRYKNHPGSPESLGVMSLTQNGLSEVGNAMAGTGLLKFSALFLDGRIAAFTVVDEPAQEQPRIRVQGMEEYMRYHLKFMRDYGVRGWHDPQMRLHKEAFLRLVQVRRRNRQMMKQIRFYGGK